MIKRAEAAGCPVLVVTVDRMAGRNQETFFRQMRIDTRECSACHDRSSFAAREVRKPNYDGIDLASITGSSEFLQFVLGYRQRCPSLSTISL